VEEIIPAVLAPEFPILSHTQVAGVQPSAAKHGGFGLLRAIPAAS